MSTRSRIETDLSGGDLAEFQRLLATGRLTIDGLTIWLEGKGYEISRSAVGRYAQRFEEIAADLRESRQMTEGLVAELGDAAAQGKQGRLLVELARTLVFRLMTKLREDGASVSTKDVAMLGKGLAELARALRLDQDFETKVAERAAREERERNAQTAATAAVDAGASEEQVAFIRAKILGIEGRLDHGR